LERVRFVQYETDSKKTTDRHYSWIAFDRVSLKVIKAFFDPELVYVSTNKTCRLNSIFFLFTPHWISSLLKTDPFLYYHTRSAANTRINFTEVFTQSCM